MNREEFMKRLEQQLWQLPEGERREALQYYEDYFDEAGPEREAEVIRELESPEKTASVILADARGYAGGGREADAGAYTGNRQTSDSGPYRGNRQTSDSETYRGEVEIVPADSGGFKNSSNRKRWIGILLFTLFACIICPPVFGFLIGAAAVVVGLVIAAYAVFAAFVAVAIGVAAAGIGLTGFSVAILFTSLPEGIFTMGIGLLLAVLGVVGVVFTVKLCMIMYPAMFRMTVNLFRRIFHRRRVVAG